MINKSFQHAILLVSEFRFAGAACLIGLIRSAHFEDVLLNASVGFGEIRNGHLIAFGKASIKLFFGLIFAWFVLSYHEFC